MSHRNQGVVQPKAGMYMQEEGGEKPVGNGIGHRGWCGKGWGCVVGKGNVSLFSAWEAR